MAPQSNTASPFSGLVGATMAALKLRDNGYNQVAVDDEGKVALHRPSGEYMDREAGLQALEEEEGFLNKNQRPIRKRQTPRCVCCGINCGLFFKIIGILVALFFVVSAGKLIWWALTPSSTGLEGAPVFSESLGCLDASFLYNGGETTVSVPMGNRHEHAVDTHGSGVGTFLITEAPADVTEVQYKITIKTNDKALLDDVAMTYPAPLPDGTSDGVSRMFIETPVFPKASSSCMRYDVVMYVPKALKKLHIGSHSTAHVQFDTHAHLDLDNLFVTLFTLDPRNLIQSSDNVRATDLTLEVYRGWILGDVSVARVLRVATQRGDGVANVHVRPTAAVDPTDPEEIAFTTMTGAGRTDIFFENDKAFPHRPIKATHTSSRGADIYLTYKDAEFDGNIQLDSTSFTVKGAKPYTLADAKGSYTHWVGDMNGKDEITMKSKGWTGLYF
ncbi:hypothetical protein BDP27DRAFT_1382578 [Rhodocollybia butyracea]|uniref:Uncharacterized protein n=1 Tax=Rhodocollybia butyracea TaxID=206335 RepID=A0A9P5U8M2_9AGAR|nr:hypothetical protein BDP27DRAFT_1382578 [Rhodocollybia butyracea]